MNPNGEKPRKLLIWGIGGGPRVCGLEKRRLEEGWWPDTWFQIKKCRVKQGLAFCVVSADIIGPKGTTLGAIGPVR